MRLPEPLEIKGHWWLPSQPDRKVFGKLTVYDGGGGELEIEGDLSFDEEAEGNTILGKTTDGRPITIGHPVHFMPQIPTTYARFPVGEVLVGAHLSSLNEAGVKKVAFSIDGIDKWMGRSLSIRERAAEGKVEISFGPASQIEAQLNDRVKLTLSTVQDFFRPSDLQASVVLGMSLTLTFDQAESLKSIRELLQRIRGFFCFAANQIVEILHLRLHFEDSSVSNAEANRHNGPCSYYYQGPLRSRRPADLSWHRCLFNFSMVSGDFSDLMVRWLNADRKLDDCIQLYLRSITDEVRSSDERFLLLAKAAETFHRSKFGGAEMDADRFEEIRRHLIDACPEDSKVWLSEKLEFANEPTFAKRLRELMGTFPRHFPPSAKRKRLISTIVQSRNYRTHFHKRPSIEVADPEALSRATRALDALVALSLLKLMEPSEESWRRIETHSEVLKRQIWLGLR